MEKERRTGSREEQENLNGRRIVYRFSDEEEGRFKTADIKNTASDEINRFVRKELLNIEETIKKRRKTAVEASSKKRHGQLPSRSKVSQQREELNTEINQLHTKKQILTGKTDSPIVFVKKDDEITGSSLSLTHKEASWWSFLKENREIFQLPTEDREILTRAYFLRYDMRSNDPQAKRKYYELIEGLRDRDDETTIGYLAKITKKLAG